MTPRDFSRVVVAVVWAALGAVKVVSFVRDGAASGSTVVGVVELAIGSAMLFPSSATVATRASAVLSLALTAATFLPAAVFAKFEGACGCLGTFDASIAIRRFIALALLTLTALVMSGPRGHARSS